MVLLGKIVIKINGINRVLNISVQKYRYCIFDSNNKKIYQRKDSIFNECNWENKIFICRRKKLDLYLLQMENLLGENLGSF